MRSKSGANIIDIKKIQKIYSKNTQNTNTNAKNGYEQLKDEYNIQKEDIPSFIQRINNLSKQEANVLSHLHDAYQNILEESQEFIHSAETSSNVEAINNPQNYSFEDLATKLEHAKNIVIEQNQKDKIESLIAKLSKTNEQLTEHEKNKKELDKLNYQACIEFVPQAIKDYLKYTKTLDKVSEKQEELDEEHAYPYKDMILKDLTKDDVKEFYEAYKNDDVFSLTSLKKFLTEKQDKLQEEFLQSGIFNIVENIKKEYQLGIDQKTEQLNKDRKFLDNRLNSLKESLVAYNIESLNNEDLSLPVPGQNAQEEKYLSFQKKQYQKIVNTLSQAKQGIDKQKNTLNQEEKNVHKDTITQLITEVAKNQAACIKLHHLISENKKKTYKLKNIVDKANLTEGDKKLKKLLSKALLIHEDNPEKLDFDKKLAKKIRPFMPQIICTLVIDPLMLKKHSVLDGIKKVLSSAMNSDDVNKKETFKKKIEKVISLGTASSVIFAVFATFSPITLVFVIFSQGKKASSMITDLKTVHPWDDTAIIISSKNNDTKRQEATLAFTQHQTPDNSPLAQDAIKAQDLRKTEQNPSNALVTSHSPVEDTTGAAAHVVKVGNEAKKPDISENTNIDVNKILQ